MAQFLKGRFRELGGWRLDEDTFTETTPHGKKEFTNLVYTLDPFAKRRLTLAAHYDSKFFARGKFLGASDSGMGCEGVSENCLVVMCGIFPAASNTGLSLMCIYLEKNIHTYTAMPCAMLLHMVEILDPWLKNYTYV